MLAKPNSALILVADDDAFVRHMLTRYLRKEGYTVVEAANGDEAVSLYFRHAPDLILLDVLMPVMDGFQVCQRLHTLTAGHLPPILMVTGLEDEKSVDEAFEIGVVDYVTKPIHWAVLRQRVQRLIAQHRLELELREANHQLRQLTLMDGLTQIANRRYFDECLRQEWGRSLREQTPLSLIICDIDYFKLYNDHYGHPAGDRCLQQVAQALTQSIHRPSDFVSRYGGEEFAVILPNTPLPGAIEVGNRLVRQTQTLAIPHVHSPIADVVTLSCGGASLTPLASYLPSDLVSTADQALYQAKNDGRNQFHAFAAMPSIPCV
ncbi:MAG: diguanylate cyclase response regulator [Leptolyngbya sp.]|nr:MAG: diguanylate cyclase response regulator [Leptolyngbya sp.]